MNKKAIIEVHAPVLGFDDDCVAAFQTKNTS
jgi:hypothetical protein